MRPLLSVAAVALATAVAPAAHACTIENCVEARVAHGTAGISGTDLHPLAAECAVVGRAGVTFQVAGWVATAGHAVADDVSVRCRLYASGNLVLDQTSVSSGPAAALASSVVATPNTRICVDATGIWADGHTSTVSTCR